MFGPFERAVAGRYLRARKGERFVSIIAIFSLVGIALGVATLIVVTSVMSGFQVELVRRILGLNGHIEIQAYAGQAIDGYAPLLSQIRAVPGVVSALGVLDGQALLTTSGGGARGGLVRGITLDDLRALAPVSHNIVAGSLDRFTGEDAIAIGVGLAEMYRLRIGDPLTVISPQGAATAFGTIPRVRAYKVAAIFDAGLNDYNSSVVFLPLRRGADLLPEARCRSPASRSASPTPSTSPTCCRRCAASSRDANCCCATGATPTTPSSACCRCRRTRCSSCSA